MPIIASIEAGGTKTKCAVFDSALSPPRILEQVQFATSTPSETLGQVIQFFQQKNLSAATPIRAIGVASFGPIDLKPSSPTYGYVTTTPKPHWGNFDYVGTLLQEFALPIGWDTDVNAAAFAEHLWGCAQACDPVLYITVGTGFGAGVYANGAPLHGLLHPEMGHITVRSHEQDLFQGSCPFHQYCLEGMASGSSMQKRWGQPGYELPENHIAWDIEAYYLAQGIANFILTHSPQKIILGGGVMQQKQLFQGIHLEVQKRLNGYVQSPQILQQDEIVEYICPPALGDDVGLYGAAALALSVLKKENC